MKIFLTILTIFILQLSFAQMRVEDIKTDADVTEFMHIYYPETKSQYNAVSFCEKLDSILLQEQIIKHFYDSIDANKDWLTMDINKDGKLDLVFCGCIDNKNNTLMFLSDNETIYKRVEIQNEFRSKRQFAYQSSNDTLFVGGTKIRFMFDTSAYGKMEVMVDTIIYSRGSLTEINRMSTYKQINSIRIGISSPFDRGCYRYITIFKNGDLKMNAVEEVNGTQMANKYTLPASAIAASKLLNMAEYLPFYKYSGEYESNVLDGGWWNTTFFFTDKTQMHISDHMGVGPFGLQLIYNYVDDLFSTKNWKLVSSESGYNN